MKSLYEQAKDLEEDAKAISEMIKSNKDVADEIAKLCYKYAILRVDLIKEK